MANGEFRMTNCPKKNVEFEIKACSIYKSLHGKFGTLRKNGYTAIQNGKLDKTP